jgi:hypothetical protein
MMTNGGRSILASFVAIANPYDVYKLVQQVHDGTVPKVA